MLEESYAKRSVLDRFMAKVDTAGPNGCWLWIASLNNQGYGQFKLTPKPLNTVGAHRVALMLFRGIAITPRRTLSGTMSVDHLCRNRRCVNPDHLEYVSQQENVRRALFKSHCKHGHLFDAVNTYVIKRRRQCRVCHAASEERRRTAGIATRQQPGYRRPQSHATAARRAVSEALRRGQIAKQPCAQCGSDHVEAHHTDYLQPLVVTWLCRYHHREAHRLAKVVEVMS